MKGELELWRVEYVDKQDTKCEVETVKMSSEGKEIRSGLKNSQPNQTFHNTFHAPVAGFQQAGESNISNIIQNIDFNGVLLDAQALEELQKLINNLATYKPQAHNELSQKQALEGALILSELKESVERKDESEQIEAVSKWRQYLIRVGEHPLITGMGIAADSLSLTLPLIKFLLTGSPL